MIILLLLCTDIFVCVRCRTVADQAKRQLISIVVNYVDTDVETELISAVQSLYTVSLNVALPFKIFIIFVLIFIF